MVSTHPIWRMTNGFKCMPTKTSYRGGLKLAVWKQQAKNKNLSTVWSKRRKMGLRRSKKEKRERKRLEKLELLKNCAVHLRIFQILKLWTTGQTICRNCHRLVITKLSTTWFMDRANSSKGKIWNVLNNWKHSNFLRTGTCKRLN